MTESNVERVLGKLDERTIAIKHGMDDISKHLKDHGGRIRDLEDENLRGKARRKLAARIGAAATAVGGTIGGWIASS